MNNGGGGRRRPLCLFEDETTVRLFPPLRAKWAPRGTQPVVRVTGRNDRRVLFATIDPRTGHRVVMRGRSMGQAEFQRFLRLLHRRYAGREAYLILDDARCHTARGTAGVAAALGAHFVALPRQSPELNPVDHLWRPAKGKAAANRQYPTADDAALAVERYVLHLSPARALRLAGIRSENFWLPDVV